MEGTSAGGDEDDDITLKGGNGDGALQPYVESEQNKLVMGGQQLQHFGENYARLYVKASGKEAHENGMYVHITTRQVYINGNHYHGEGDAAEPIAQLSGTGYEGELEDANNDINGPELEATETAPRRQPHEIAAAKQISAAKSLDKQKRLAAAGEEVANCELAASVEKAVAGAKTAVASLYSAAAKKEAAGAKSDTLLPGLSAAAALAEADFTEAWGAEAPAFVLSFKRLLDEPQGLIGETKAKAAYTMMAALYTVGKHKRIKQKGARAGDVADLNAAILDRSTKRRRGRADTVEVRQQQAASELAQAQQPDTAEGDQALLDARLKQIYA